MPDHSQCLGRGASCHAQSAMRHCFQNGFCTLVQQMRLERASKVHVALQRNLDISTKHISKELLHRHPKATCTALLSGSMCSMLQRQ